MGIECGVIAVLFIIIGVVFIRKKRIQWALATLPLTLVPLCEFVLGLVVGELFGATVDIFVRLIALVVAVAVSCVWIGFVSGGFKNKKRRFTYIGITNIFNVTLAVIIIYNILTVTNL